MRCGPIVRLAATGLLLVWSYLPVAPTDRSLDRPTNRPIDRTTDRPIDRPTDRPIDRPTDRLATATTSSIRPEPLQLREIDAGTDAGPLHFRSSRETPPARFIGDGTRVLDALTDTTRWETRILRAFLEGEEDVIRQYTDPAVADYLPRELLEAVGVMDRSPPGTYQLAAEGRSPLRFVLVEGERVLEIMLYTEEDLLVDGEVIVRSRSRADTLSTDTSAAPGVLP
jgi:hypothetical protein